MYMWWPKHARTWLLLLFHLKLIAETSGTGEKSSKGNRPSPKSDDEEGRQSRTSAPVFAVKWMYMYILHNYPAVLSVLASIQS